MKIALRNLFYFSHLHLHYNFCNYGILWCINPIDNKAARAENICPATIKVYPSIMAWFLFLYLGETFRSLSFQFRIGERTISEETCQALYIALKQQYMKVTVS